MTHVMPKKKFNFQILTQVILSIFRKAYVLQIEVSCLIEDLIYFAETIINIVHIIIFKRAYTKKNFVLGSVTAICGSHTILVTDPFSIFIFL